MESVLGSPNLVHSNIFSSIQFASIHLIYTSDVGFESILAEQLRLPDVDVSIVYFDR